MIGKAEDRVQRDSSTEDGVGPQADDHAPLGPGRERDRPQLKGQVLPPGMMGLDQLLLAREIRHQGLSVRKFPEQLQLPAVVAIGQVALQE